MIAEAVDTAVTLGWALAVWVLLLAAAATAALLVLLVMVTLACMAVSRGVRASLALVQHLRADRAPRGAPNASSARTALSRPAWAQPDKDAA